MHTRSVMFGVPWQVEELACMAAPAQETIRNIAQHLYDTADHVHFVLSRKQRNTEEEFAYNTSQTPHVNLGVVVWSAEKHFRRAIEPRLNIGVYGIVQLARGPKIYDLNLCGIQSLQQNVFGLKVAVYYFRLDKDIKGLQNLVDDTAQYFQTYTDIAVLLEELVEVYAELFKYKTKMAAEDEMRVKLDNMPRIFIVIVAVQHAQNVNLDPSLVEVRRLVLDNFDRHNLPCPLMTALDNLPKSSVAQQIQDRENVAVVIGERVVDVKDVIMKPIVKVVVVHRLARLCKTAPRDGLQKAEILIACLVKRK